MLIQRVSLLVPIEFMKLGQLKTTGHVCAFEQDIMDICSILPRLPKDVVHCKTVKRHKDSQNQQKSKNFLIRKTKVLEALLWLKENNPECQDIEVKMENFEWMGVDEEKELPVAGESISHVTEEEEEEKDVSVEKDLGPNASLTSQNLHSVYGLHQKDTSNFVNKKDLTVQASIEKALEASHSNTSVSPLPHEKFWFSKCCCFLSHICPQKIPTFPFPSISKTAIDEFDERRKLHCLAFPWLFPGGHGDLMDVHDVHISKEDWAKTLLQHKDGRFSTDRLWSFCTANVLSRHKNNRNGAFFVNSFFKDGPKNLDELKTTLENGNHEWIDRINYFSKSVFGSSSYWRSKKGSSFLD